VVDLPARVGSDFARAFDAQLVEQTTARWEFWFGLLQRFVERERHARVPQSHLEDGYRLGTWVNTQRAFHNRGQLSDDRITRLQMIPGWVWEAGDAKWEEAYALLCDYAARQGNALVPQSYEQNGINLGTWANTQRIWHSRLSPGRRERLDQVPGWVWSIVDARWENAFGLLLSYVTRMGDALVPVDYVEGDFRLGQWVRGQRSRRERLEPERRSRLEAVPGWVWDPGDARWEEAYKHLCAYAERVGSARVPQGYLEDGYRLGQWVISQRSRCQDQERRARLEELPGWVWDTKEAQWEEAYELLCAYAEREGTARVPPDYVLGDIRLGRWVVKQRSRRKMLDSEHQTRLQQVPGWVWDAYEAQWNEAYSLLCAYTEREGNALVPQNHVEAGFKLGGWVSVQRNAYKRGNLGAERVARLEALPDWVWLTRRSPTAGSRARPG